MLISLHYQRKEAKTNDSSTLTAIPFRSGKVYITFPYSPSFNSLTTTCRDLRELGFQDGKSMCSTVILYSQYPTAPAHQSPKPLPLQPPTPSLRLASTANSRRARTQLNHNHIYPLSKSGWEKKFENAEAVVVRTESCDRFRGGAKCGRWM